MLALAFSCLLPLVADPALVPYRLQQPAFAAAGGQLAYIAESWNGDQLRQITASGKDLLVWDAAAGGRTIDQFAAAGDGWLVVARDRSKAPALWHIDDDRNSTPLTPNDWPEGERLGAALLHNGGGEWLLTLDHRLPYFPDVYRYHQGGGPPSVIEANPGDVSRWLADEAGVIRLRLRHPGAPGTEPIYLWEWRAHPLDRWRQLHRWRLGDPAWQALSLGAGDLWLNAETRRRDTLGLQRLVPPGTAPEAPLAALAAADLGTVLFAPQSGRPLLVAWEGLLPLQQALDAEWEAVLETIRSAHPAFRQRIAQISPDETRVLVRGFDGRQPDRWWIYDRANDTWQALGTEHSTAAALPAPLKPLRFTARDGLPLTAYYAPPAGGGNRHTPLVVLVHGGPWARDLYQYEALPALLAAHGFGVLQVNFRGSEGFGRSFLLAGAKAFGGAMQDDLADGIAALTARGLADPARVCIAGMSYGGYAALNAVLTEPGRYRCALAHAPVTELAAHITALEARGDTLGGREWRALVGDPRTDAAQLAARSPLHIASQLSRPVLLSHGTADGIVNPEQSRRFRAAAPPGLVSEFAFTGGHQLTTAAERMTIYLNWLLFLNAHLKPVMPPEPNSTPDNTVPAGVVFSKQLTAAPTPQQPPLPRAVQNRRYAGRKKFQEKFQGQSWRSFKDSHGEVLRTVMQEFQGQSCKT